MSEAIGILKISLLELFWDSEYLEVNVFDGGKSSETNCILWLNAFFFIVCLLNMLTRENLDLRKLSFLCLLSIFQFFFYSLLDIRDRLAGGSLLHSM
jgi:hypothetical protein